MAWRKFVLGAEEKRALISVRLDKGVWALTGTPQRHWVAQVIRDRQSLPQTLR